MRQLIKRNKISNILTLVTFCLVLTSCGTSQKYKYGANSISQQTIINTAKKMLGVKYRYGGTSPKKGFDCSGLVQYSHQAAGIHLPRTTGQQFRAAKRISTKYLKPGDLVFFKTIPSRAVSHVGIYLGNSKFIHAPSTGKRVKISSMKERYWLKRFTGAGRAL